MYVHSREPKGNAATSSHRDIVARADEIKFHNTQVGHGREEMHLGRVSAHNNESMHDCVRLRCVASRTLKLARAEVSFLVCCWMMVANLRKLWYMVIEGLEDAGCYFNWYWKIVGLGHYF